MSRPYDCFVLEEGGQLVEQVLGEFRDLDLHYAPGLTTVATGAEALALVREQPRFNLVISALHLADMNGAELARAVRATGLDVPVVLLGFDNRELEVFKACNDLGAVERVFLWQGDARILLAIVKYVEDKLNAPHDTQTVGVQVILLIEDDVRFYSSYLPAIYAELLHHSQRLLAEGVNLSHKIMRMRARPKVLLCDSFEDAWQVFERYQEDILGVVSDVEFPRAGVRAPDAGITFARMVRERWPDVPVLLQSSRPDYEQQARDAGSPFLLKGSPLLLRGLRRFMLENFGFGDFVFRLPGGEIVGRAADLKRLEELLHLVPAESIAYHAERNHFSKWLKARTEFELADALRPRQLADFESVEHLRRDLVAALAAYRHERSQTVVADFARDSFDLANAFYRIGGGSLGGKARGLAFVRRLLADSRTGQEFPDVRVAVPPAVVLGTDVFDAFLEENGLRAFAIETDDDEAVRERFLAARFPAGPGEDLAVLLENLTLPLAVRSSSLLEDSRYQPFTGVYETFMLRNNQAAPERRLQALLRAVKRVYASTFSRHAKAYIRATPYRLEEEKMAVLIQPVVGAARGGRFYPDFAGVARSHNFYPTPPLEAADGIVAVGLGLGRTVVEGGNCVRFCPRYPRHLTQFSSVADVLRNSQRSFWALDLEGAEEDGGPDSGLRETRFELDTAEADGALALLGSTYSPENNAVYDGLGRAGLRLVSFAPILKHGAFPLGEILGRLLEVSTWGLGAPVEIEFAANLIPAPGAPRELAVLQLRPLALSREVEALTLDEVGPAQVLCRSRQVLGHGRVEGLCDLVVVDQHRFERAQSRQTAQEIAQFNAALMAIGAPYLLVGVGRWGSADPWLGIPVAWDQIAGARVIVEAGFRDFLVTPSQGTHFFQNLTSFNVGYFTVNPDAGQGELDWAWLAAQPALRETSCVRWLRFPQPLLVQMNGHRGEGVILKPGLSSR